MERICLNIFHYTALGSINSPFNYILQLSYITRPVVGQKLSLHFFGEDGDILPAKFRCHSYSKVVCKKKNIIPPISKRGYKQHIETQSIKQVFLKLTFKGKFL